jgi:hypothetical protein
MKVGDLVRCTPNVCGDVRPTGIVIEVVVTEPEIVPPVVKVLWDSGVIDKEWIDELEVIS